MHKPQTTLAIFDFDGTLTEGHLWVGLAAHHRRHKIKRLAMYEYLLFHLPLYLASKAKLVSQERNHRKWGEDVGFMLKGLTPAQGRKVFEWVMDQYFLPRMRPEITQRLKEHAAQGHRTMVLSGVLTDFLEVVQMRLNIDYAVGTHPEIRADRYTGRIIQPLCFGENKAKALVEFIQQNKLEVDLQQSWAYADSVYDTPILEMVGNPVAVYPDKNLEKLAQARKWQIITGQ
jgi:HAD superfamily hydrolase (TIGR01490 family)